MTVALQRIIQVRAGEPGAEGSQFGNDGEGGVGHSISFTTRAADVGRPAECDLSIYNLAPASMGLFEKAGNLVQVRAGHRTTRVGMVFQGNPTPGTLKVKKVGGDIVTSVTLRDGGRKYDTGRVSLSLRGPVTGRQVFDEILAQSGFGEGQVTLRGASWPRRYVFDGSARAALDDLVETVGPSYAWFIRDGNIHILDKDDKTPETAPLFSADTGTLVGSPEPVEGGGVRFRGILNTSVRVGRTVELESLRHNGHYKVVEAGFNADNFGQSFYVNVKGVPYGS